MAQPNDNAPSSSTSRRSNADLGREFFPNSGSGRIRRISDSRGQGQSSPRRMGKCKSCGFINDFRKIDTGGGSENGDGAYNGGTTTTASGTTLAGATITDTYREGSLSVGGGCAFCGTKNAANEQPTLSTK